MDKFQSEKPGAKRRISYSTYGLSHASTVSYPGRDPSTRVWLTGAFLGQRGGSLPLKVVEAITLPVAASLSVTSSSIRYLVMGGPIL